MDWALMCMWVRMCVFSADLILEITPFSEDVAGCWLWAGPWSLYGNSVGEITWKRFHHLIILVSIWLNEWMNEMTLSLFFISSSMLIQNCYVNNPHPSAYKNPSWNILNHWIRMGTSGHQRNDCVLSHKRAFGIGERGTSEQAKERERKRVPTR